MGILSLLKSIMTILSMFIMTLTIMTMAMTIMKKTWMVLPVSGVMPSMVRMISNCIFEEMSRAENSYNGDSSSENVLLAFSFFFFRILACIFCVRGPEHLEEETNWKIFLACLFCVRWWSARTFERSPDLPQALSQSPCSPDDTGSPMTVCDLWSDKDKDNYKDTIGGKILKNLCSIYLCHPHLSLFRHLPLHHLSRHVRFQKMRRPVMLGNFEEKLK